MALYMFVGDVDVDWMRCVYLPLVAHNMLNVFFNSNKMLTIVKLFLQTIATIHQM